MKVNGIVAEYNPFHNGHAYQLQHAKEANDADYTIIVMSGNFMQRGAPALLDKFTRTKMALENGADLVLELPTRYAASSAEFFAKGSVALFDKLGVTTNLCFGSECGNIEVLSRIAEIFYTEPEPYVESLRCNMRKGMSFPIARTAIQAADGILCGLRQVSGYFFGSVRPDPQYPAFLRRLHFFL